MNYPLLSDPGKDVAKAYGVLKAGLFATRKTIVIDEEGAIAHVETKVSPRTAGDDLIALLAELRA